MSAPAFIHIMSTGDIWFSNDVNFIPKGTILSTHRINSDASSQKIGTITATSSTVSSVSGATGRFGKEIV